jgi:outer membrane protein insertion porin family
MRAFACLAFAVVLAAQTPPRPGTLHSVSVKGNRLYSSEDIVTQTGLKVGQPVSAPVLEKARLKLQETELFTNVADQYRTTGNPPQYDVTFEIAENEQLFPMRFERLGATPEAISSYLKTHVDLYSDRIPGTDGVLHRYTAAVQAFLAQTTPTAKVRAAISNDDPQQLIVLFTPDAPTPTISQVLVSGNQAIDTGTILRAVNQVAIGVPLSDARLKAILEGAIKPVYAAKGYAAVSFPKVETEPAKSNLGVIVKVEIKDGPLFKFGAVRFRGKGMEEEEIRSNITFKPGQTFDARKVDDFRIDLAHRMRMRGLLDATITAQSDPDDEKRAVNVTYNIIPGEPYNFQKLDIQGLDLTTQPVIAKLWGEKPGHPFNPEYPEFFLKKVQEQGLFDNLANTHSDYTADASSHSVTVHLYFKGGKSAADKEKEKKDEKERRQSDGTWDPYPQVLSR